MININNVSKMYGKYKALTEVNVTIPTGQAIAFLGANGSGKTTMIEIIAGIIEPTNGEIIIDGINSSKADSVGIQFQEGSWPKGITPKIVLEFYKSSDFNSEKIRKYINIFEIDEFLNKDLNNLSGGQKQRFNAFLAVANNKKIIILDELITGLDLKMQIKLIAFFKKYQIDNNATLIVVSHMPEEVELLCDRVIILEKGKIKEDFMLKDMLKKYKNLREKMTDYYEHE